MGELLILLQLISTLPMVGLIWFVQVVHYPLFVNVGTVRFTDYERAHVRRTSFVVVPLMLLEASTTVLLLFNHPEEIAFSLVILGVILLAVVWASTFLLQVPAHQALERAFDAPSHRNLVHTNWLRTIAWTLRGLLVCWMNQQLMI